MTQEVLEAFKDEGIKLTSETWETAQPSDNKRLQEQALPPAWPEHWLEICEWGCNISSYIHAETGPIMTVADSLEEWLEHWLAGGYPPIWGSSIRLLYEDEHGVSHSNARYMRY